MDGDTPNCSASRRTVGRRSPGSITWSVTARSTARAIASAVETDVQYRVGMDTALYDNKDSGDEELTPTERTTLHRLPARGSYERSTIHGILDEAFICHVGIATDTGPVVIPTTYGRVGDVLYLHGSPASHLLRTMKQGVDVCVTVTLVDGLVLARSTFHHSINYRAVMVFGTAVEVTDVAEKAVALAAIVEHIVPGRTADARPATDKEVRGTSVLALSLTEASAKVRRGGPADDNDDLALPVWAGVLPLTTTPGLPDAAPDLVADVAVPAYVERYVR